VASDPEPGPARTLSSRPFLALLLMQSAFGLALSTFLLLPKVLSASFGAGALAIGVVTAALGVAGVAVVPLLGTQIDRHGARAPILLGNLLMAASAFGFVLVEDAGPLAVLLRGLQGAAWTMVFNAGMTMTAALAPPGRLAQAIGVYGSANLVTNAIAPALAEPLIERLGHRPVFAGAGAMALVAWALARRLDPTRPMATGAPQARFAVLLSDRRYQALATVAVVAGVAFGVMFTFTQPFALQVGIGRVRSFFIGYTAGALAVRLGAGRLLDRMGHGRAVIGALAMYGAVVAATALLAPGLLGLLGCLFGLAHGAFMPAALALAISWADAAARPRALALMNGAMVAGAAFVPAVGAAADSWGYPSVFVTLGAATFATMLLVPSSRSRSA